MDAEHFEEFSSLITGIYRHIQRLKNQANDLLGIKSVHTFWVYLLRRYPEGLTASELSRYSKTNRSLVSREINELLELGYVTTDRQSSHRRYGWKFLLTDKGQEVAEQIGRISMDVQNRVSAGIPEEDLEVFYRTCATLLSNFETIDPQKEEELCL